MARIQLLAVDVDGTLVTTGDEISAPTRAALHRLRGAGVEVAIATGRRYRKAQGAIDALGFPVPSGSWAPDPDAVLSAAAVARC